MDKLNFAILGTGMVAHYHKVAVEKNHDKGAHLTAISHYRPERFSALSEAFGVPCVSLESILSDTSIDVVCICTPSGQHAAQAIASLNAGKHVLVEKPMALSVNDAKAMIAAAKANNRHLSVALQRRADPLFISVKEAITNGDLGELTLGSIVMPYFRNQAYYDQAPWRGTWALDGGGVLMNQGIHIIDILLWLMGDPVEVHAFAATLHRDIEVEDVATAALKFPTGSMATISATTTVGGGAPHRIELFGTNGTIQVEGEGVVRWDLLDESKMTVTPAAISSDTSAGAGADPKGISTAGHEAIVADLIRAIHTEGAPAIDGTEGLRSLSAIHSIYRAAGITVPD